MTPPAIIYVHGYMAPSRIMALLRRRVAAAGHDGEIFAWPSLVGGLGKHADELRSRLLARPADAPPPWIVGHSAGGLVARLALSGDGAATAAGLVLIATPNHGCEAARRWRRNPVPRMLLGAPVRDLEGFTAIYADALRPLDLPIGLIAGGIGSAAGYRADLPGDNDGTIRVDEVRLEGARELAVVNRPHNALPLSRCVARLVTAFIERQTFAGVPCPLRLECPAAPPTTTSLDDDREAS